MKKTLVVLCLFLCSSSFAFIKLGVGQHSTTSGRRHPLLYAAFEGDSAGISLSSVGHQNSLGYFSAYQGSFLFRFKPLKFLWGSLDAGLGLGFLHYEEGYKDDLNSTTEKRTGQTAGPSMRVLFHFTPVTFFGFEALYGLNPKYLWPYITLNPQDAVQFIIGVDL